MSEIGEVPVLDEAEIYRVYYAEVAAPRAARAHQYVNAEFVAATMGASRRHPATVASAGITYEVTEHEEAEDDLHAARGLRDLVSA